MFNGGTMLTCSEYFLGRPRPCLTGTRKAKGVEGDWTTVSIKDISAGGILIWSVFVGAVSVGATFA